MSNFKKVKFFHMTKQSSKSERLAKLKESLLALGLKYKPKESSNVKEQPDRKQSKTQIT